MRQLVLLASLLSMMSACGSGFGAPCAAGQSGCNGDAGVCAEVKLAAATCERPCPCPSGYICAASSSRPDATLICYELP
jgi:hypothetical protein